MTTCTLPPADLARVTPDLLRGYLEARGWTCAIPRRYQEEEWTGADHNYLIMLYTNPSGHMGEWAVVRTVMSLADYEDRCPRAVLADVLGEGEAALQYKLAVATGKGSEWESLADRSIEAYGMVVASHNALHARVATLEAALGWYGDRANYAGAWCNWSDRVWIIADGGQRAREALGQEATSG